MKKNIKAAALFLLMAILLYSPKLCVEGARQGLLLWYQTVLPTLLPFMICTNLLVNTPLPGLPRRAFVFLCGALCGYPMGAKVCSDFLDQRRLSERDAKLLYAVSNYPSPMFVLGYILPALTVSTTAWRLLLCFYLPALPIGLLAAFVYPKSQTAPAAGSFAKDPDGSSNAALGTLEHALMASIEVMVKIGGYLMIFAILSLYLRKISLLPDIVRLFFISLVEMTTSIRETAAAATGLTAALLMIWAAAFGGLSGIFQVKSVTKNAGLSIRHYVVWKILHGLLSCILFILLSAPAAPGIPG